MLAPSFLAAEPQTHHASEKTKVGNDIMNYTQKIQLYLRILVCNFFYKHVLILTLMIYHVLLLIITVKHSIKVLHK